MAFVFFSLPVGQPNVFIEVEPEREGFVTLGADAFVFWITLVTMTSLDVDLYITSIRSLKITMRTLIIVI